MDFPAHVEDQFQWLLTMARSPGWKAQAWHRAQELAAECPSLYAGFPERLKAEMSTLNSPASPARSNP